MKRWKSRQSDPVDSPFWTLFLLSVHYVHYGRNLSIIPAQSTYTILDTLFTYLSTME